MMAQNKKGVLGITMRNLIIIIFAVVLGVILFYLWKSVKGILST